MRAREMLDRLLEHIELDARAVFVLFEIEGFTVPEIADLLEDPAGDGGVAPSPVTRAVPGARQRVFAACGPLAREAPMRSTRPLAKTGSDVERLLLAAGADERPDTEAVRKAASVLGLVPRAALIAATLGVTVRATRWTSVVAWGSLSLVGVAGIALVAHTDRSAPAVAVTAVATPTWRPPPAPPPEAPLPATPALAEAAPSPPSDVHAVARRVAGSSAQADGLREQSEALDRVRALLAVGDAEAALARLGEYDRRYAGGPLREEAMLLRIESLARRGDRDKAAALARRFLKVYPSSVHVNRVAALLRELPEESGAVTGSRSLPTRPADYALSALFVAAASANAGCTGERILLGADPAGDAAVPATFTAPELVTELAAPGADDDKPTLTSDRLEIYFLSTRDGGPGSGDVWHAVRSESGDAWEAPSLVAEVSSPSQEKSPAVSADGLTLWVASDRAGGLGGLDIWVSTRPDRSSAWSAPVPVPALNSTGDEIRALQVKVGSSCRSPCVRPRAANTTSTSRRVPRRARSGWRRCRARTSTRRTRMSTGS